MTDSRALSTILRTIVRVGLYRRISRDEHTGGTFSGLGVARQETKTRARIAMMNRNSAAEEYVVVRVFDENNTKATAKSRPALAEALAAVKAGEIDAIAFYAQDRFTRMPDELESILKFHTKHPLRIITSTGGELNLNDPHVRHAMRGAVNNAALELEVNRERSLDESEQRAAAGKPHGRAPFGWRRVNVFGPSGARTDWYDVLNEPEAQLVRDAARQILAGVSLRAIVASIQDGPVRPRGHNFAVESEDGTKTLRPSSPQWTSDKLRHILLRESNAGLRRHRGKILENVKAKWEPILDMGTYTRLVAVLKDPARNRLTDKGTARTWLLSGILVCADCQGKDGSRINGRRANGKTRSTTPTYICTGCFQSHPAADLDAWVCAATEAALERRQFSQPADDSEQLLAEAYARLDAIDAEDLVMTADKNAGKISYAVLASLLAGNADRRVAIRAEIDALMPSTAATLDLPNGFAGATLAQQRAVIQSQFSAIIVSRRPKRTRQRAAAPFDPAYVQMVER